MEPPPSAAHKTSANYIEHQPNVSTSTDTDRIANPSQKMHDVGLLIRLCYEGKAWCRVHLLRQNLKAKFLLLPFILLLVLGQFFISLQLQGYFDQKHSFDYHYTLKKNYILYDYDAVYSSGGTHESYKDKRLSYFQSFYRYTSTDILRNGCSLTVALTDPRIPQHGYNHPVWFMLESVASFVPYACVVVHTASCQIIKQTSNIPVSPTVHQVEVAAHFIYERSLPLFRRMMERGQVRIAILEKGSFNIEKCAEWDISKITMNLKFWKEQFINGTDSDMILFVQSDSVLCHYFDINLWAQFAYVGAPWGKGGLWPSSCDFIRNQWRSWAPQCSLLNPDLDLPLFCTQGHGGAVGNGGFSLRNRTWMIRAIESCPTQYSGLESFSLTTTTPEDVYFSVILTGMHAAMPSAFEASLFSVEAMFPEQAAKEYFDVLPFEFNETIRRLWGNDTGLLMYDRMHQVETYFSNTSIESTTVARGFGTIPIGFHTPWYHHSEILNRTQIQQECKFLKFIYNVIE
jgi:hypothetical protein